MDAAFFRWPAGVDPLSARFVDRFARYAKAVAEFLADYAHGVPIYTPINEFPLSPGRSVTAGTSTPATTTSNIAKAS
jgi:hypothetical protein